MAIKSFYFFGSYNEWMPLSTGATSSMNLRFATSNGVGFQVKWLDGSVGTYANNATATKTHATPMSGIVMVRAVSGGLLNFTQMTSTDGAWNFDISILKYYLPLLTYLNLYGNSMTLTGSIDNLSNLLTYLNLYGNSMTLTGSIDNLSNLLTFLSLNGSLMSLTGSIDNLSNLLTFLSLSGSLMSLTGSIDNLSNLLTYLLLSGNLMSLTGSIDNLSNLLTLLYLGGNLMSLTGSIDNLSNLLTFLSLSGSLMSLTYNSGRTWANVTNITLRLATGKLTSTEVDNLFIDLDASPLVLGVGTLDTRGSNGAPTATSLSARTSLATKGKTVLTN